MRPKKVDEAANEAKRFLDRVRKLKAAVGSTHWNGNEHIWGSKETAAVRRASLDLTRALAEMRKADWS